LFTSPVQFPPVWPSWQLKLMFYLVCSSSRLPKSSIDCAILPGSSKAKKPGDSVFLTLSKRLRGHTFPKVSSCHAFSVIHAIFASAALDLFVNSNTTNVVSDGLP